METVHLLKSPANAVHLDKEVHLMIIGLQLFLADIITKNNLIG